MHIYIIYIYIYVQLILNKTNCTQYIYGIHAIKAGGLAIKANTRVPKTSIVHMSQCPAQTTRIPQYSRQLVLKHLYISEAPISSINGRRWFHNNRRRANSHLPYNWGRVEFCHYEWLGCDALDGNHLGRRGWIEDWSDVKWGHRWCLEWFKGRNWRRRRYTTPQNCQGKGTHSCKGKHYWALKVKIN